MSKLKKKKKKDRQKERRVQLGPKEQQVEGAGALPLLTGNQVSGVHVRPATNEVRRMSFSSSPYYNEKPRGYHTKANILFRGRRGLQ